MNITALLGLVIGIGGILLGNLIEGGHANSLVQGAAAVIVICGTFGATLLSSKKEDVHLGLVMLRWMFLEDKGNNGGVLLAEIVECTKVARKETILSLEPRLPQIRDPFLQDVLRSVVDGVDPKIIREIFEKRIQIEEEKMLAAAKIWTDAGGYAPTIGIIGAVLGLIHVMSNLSDTSKLGAGIAVAFVATIYGVGIANLVFLPIGNRLKKKVIEQSKIKEMTMEGGIGILNGLTPFLVELKLRPYLDSGR